MLWEEEDVWSCAYCDVAFGPEVVSEVDHVIPLAKGGVHEWSNLAPSCRECNRAKSDADITAWLAALAGGSSAERDAPNTESCEGA
ncbi:HNH endonuclease [Streptomyces sp. NPDC091259]|uniref:HNH endonuclease n=1 Tax=Streptomyces sp. NPDC091259 TaxID=3365976 RepID=UPI003827988E